jgi:hypothetical protein
MTDLNDWKMAERIAENSNTFKTPQDVMTAFEDLIRQVEAESDGDEAA